MNLTNIVDICSALHKEALNKSFYNNSEEQLNESANGFIDAFCTKNELTAHTIKPMTWSFESTDNGMIDDGVIELHNLDGNDTKFMAIDVSNSKLTDEDNIMSE